MNKKKKPSIISCIKGYWFDTIMSPLCVALEVIMEIIIPLVIADILNTIDSTKDSPRLLILKFLTDYSKQKGALIAGGILIILSCLSLLFGFLSGMFCAKASCGFAKNLRKAIYYKLQDFSFENIDKFQTSSLITRTTTDVTNVQMSFQMIIRVAVRAPFMLIFSLIMAFLLNKQIAMIFVYVVPVLALLMFAVMKLAHPNFKKMFIKYDRLNTVVQENVSGQRTVKAFVRESHEIEKFKDASKDIYKYSSRAERWLAFISPFMQSAIYVCMLFVSFVGAKLVTYSTNPSENVNFTTGDLNAFFSYIMQILMSLMMLSMIIVMVAMSKASLERIKQVLVEEPTIKNNNNPVYEVKDGSIVFDHVNFSYQNDLNKCQLTDINLNIKSGMTVGIVGGTGSAKSTLVNLIPRLYDITSGSLKIGGVEVKDYDIKSLRDQVSVVLQKNILFSGTIASNLKWGNKEASEEEMNHACKLAQASEFVDRFSDKLDTTIEQGGTNVSGGQRQRLCIARALMKHPKILILDDSTSAVDTKTDSLIRQAFKSEIPDTTKIIIAQRISSVQDCDMIVVLNDGCVDGIGTHEELLENNVIYKEVYTSQVKGAGTNE